MELMREVLAVVGLDDGIGLDDIVVFSAGSMTVLTFITFLVRPVWVEAKELLAWSAKFRTDWDGEPSRDGRDRVPGVMERMNNIDGEFRRNGGSTMKDSMFRTERAVEQAITDISAIKTQVEGVVATQSRNTMERHAVILAGDANTLAIVDAFRRAGIDPPKLVRLSDIIDPPDEPI